MTTPGTRQASVSNTHAQASINAPVSQYPSPTHLPHMSQMNTSVPPSNVSSQYVQLPTTNPCNYSAPCHQHLLQNQPATTYPYSTWWTGPTLGSDSASVGQCALQLLNLASQLVNQLATSTLRLTATHCLVTMLSCINNLFYHKTEYQSTETVYFLPHSFIC